MSKWKKVWYNNEKNEEKFAGKGEELSLLHILVFMWMLTIIKRSSGFKYAKYGMIRSITRTFVLSATHN